jgi:hypothetical protein
MKFKFNWGWGVVILYGSFVLMLGTMAVKSTQHGISLVDENYYQKDIEFEEHLNKMNNSNGLPNQLKVDYTSEDQQIILSFPDDLKAITGEILCFRPSDESKDFKVKIAPDGSFQQAIATADMITGLWRIQVNWSADGRDFYSEELVII